MEDEEEEEEDDDDEEEGEGILGVSSATNGKVDQVPKLWYPQLRLLYRSG